MSCCRCFPPVMNMNGAVDKRDLVKKTARILLLWLPLSLLSLILIGVTAARFYLSPERTERLAVSVFSSVSTGSLSMKVDESDIFGSICIRNIVVKNGPDFGGNPLAEVKTIRLKYGLLPLLAGFLDIGELTIEKPRIYLRNKNGIWNFSALFPAKEEKRGPEAESENILSLPLPVKARFNFFLNDLDVFIEGPGFSSSVRGITVRAGAETERFRTIPKSVHAVDIVRRAGLTINPRGNIRAGYSSPAVSTEPDVLFTLGLDYDKEKKSSMTSFFRFGAQKTPVRYRGTFLAPLDFLVAYDLACDPAGDSLSLRRASVSVRGKTWIALTGSVSRISSRPFVDMRMTESRIVLDDIDPYVKKISVLSRSRFGGTVSLMPVTVRGDSSDMTINAALSAAGLFVKHRESSLTAPSASMRFEGRIRGDSGDFSASVSMSPFYYVLQGSRSGANAIIAGARARSEKNFKMIVLSDFDLRFFDPESNRTAFSLKAAGSASLTPVAAAVSIRDCLFDKAPLEQMLPGRLRKKTADIALKRPAGARGSLKCSMNGPKTRAGCDLSLNVPDYDLPDLSLTLDALHDRDRKTLTLEKAGIASKKWNLLLSAGGRIGLAKKPISDSDLALSLRFESARERNVYGPWMYRGLMDVRASMKGSLSDGRATARIITKDMDVRNRDTRAEIEKMTCDLPLEAVFSRTGSARSILAADKEEIITNDFFREKPNLFVRALRAKHPAREEVFEYVRDLSAAVSSERNVYRVSELKGFAMEGPVYGREIALSLGGLDLEGAGVRNLPDSMEYVLRLDASNMDIALLDDADERKEKRDALLSFNANFSGRGINTDREITANGYVNIHRIGKKFANRLMRGLSTEKGKSKLGSLGQFVMDNFMRVKGFNFTLDRGLVYASVPLSPGVFGRIVGVENNMVRFDRLPVQEYLKKLGREE